MTWLCCRWWLCPSRHFSTLLVTQGGRGGGEIQTANQYSSPETQPFARRVGWGLRRVGWGLLHFSSSSKNSLLYVTERQSTIQLFRLSYSIVSCFPIYRPGPHWSDFSSFEIIQLHVLFFSKKRLYPEITSLLATGSVLT